jgi:hypothetical protein
VPTPTKLAVLVLQEHDPQEGLLRDEDLEYIVGGLDRPLDLPREVEQNTTRDSLSATARDRQ